MYVRIRCPHNAPLKKRKKKEYQPFLGPPSVFATSEITLPAGEGLAALQRRLVPNARLVAGTHTHERRGRAVLSARAAKNMLGFGEGERREDGMGMRMGMGMWR